MKRLTVALGLIAFLIGGAVAFAQSNTGANHTVTTGGTLPVTNNLALAANEARKGCIIQNNGTHNMSVGVHQSESFPLILAPNGTMNCGAEGMIIGDAVYITGTSGDTYVIWWQ